MIISRNLVWDYEDKVVLLIRYYVFINFFGLLFDYRVI